MQVRCNYCFELYDDVYEVCPSCGYVRGNPAREPYYIYPGMMLNNRYIVGQVLGAGGFGITYKVWDTRLETVLAIKEYYPGGMVNRAPGTKDVILFTRNRMAEYNHGLIRFLDEAKSMARFSSHKNIINVFEYFEENETAYIVMEYLDGVTLSSFLKINTLDLNTSLDLISQVCAALKDIHSAGIVHRDVSPDNIFICTNNNIKLIDFGAARFYPDEDRQMTIILKPGFAPPEQYESVNLQGPWTDIYALGSTLYLMVTGVKPEESTNRRIDDTLYAPAQINSEIPEYVSNTIMKAMAIDKHLRFHNIAEFEKALNNERKVLPVAKEKKRRKRRRLATVFASIAVIAAAAAVFIATWKMQNALNDADVTLWYSYSADTRAARDDAFNKIAEAFISKYPNINVEVMAFPQEVYASELRAAAQRGNMPTLFESTDIDNSLLAGAVDLSGMISSIDISQYYFLDRYEELFPDKNRMPLGFVAPVVYLNTSLLTLERSSVSDLGEITEAASGTARALAVNSADAMAFGSVFGSEVSAAVTDDAGRLFFTDQAYAYLSDTSEYFGVREALPASYRLLRVESARVPAAFRDLWSISECSDDERAAAEKLLESMLSDYAQDYMYLRSQSGTLPVNVNVLDLFCGVYNEFDGFFINIGSYTFE